MLPLFTVHVVSACDCAKSFLIFTSVLLLTFGVPELNSAKTNSSLLCSSVGVGTPPVLFVDSNGDPLAEFDFESTADHDADAEFESVALKSSVVDAALPVLPLLNSAYLSCFSRTQSSGLFNPLRCIHSSTIKALASPASTDPTSL